MVEGWDKGKQTPKSVYYNTISSSVLGLAKNLLLTYTLFPSAMSCHLTLLA
jgi:hypothetical protein